MYKQESFATLSYQFIPIYFLAIHKNAILYVVAGVHVLQLECF